MKRLTAASIFCFSLLSLQAKEQLIHWANFDRNELRSEAFELSSDQTIQIEAVGPLLRGWNYVSYVWILDLKTRQPVWELSDAASKRFDDNDDLKSFSDNIPLKKGAYQVFYSTTRNGWGDGSFRIHISDVFNWHSYHDLKRSDLRDFEFKLFADGEVFQNTNPYFGKEGMQAVVLLNKAKGDQYEQIGLRVEKPTEVLIYAIGEVTRDGNYDGAWLKNTETGEKIWKLDHHTSEYAGGGEKNRMCREKLELAKGSYLLTFFSDDSHHYDDWNVTPPYDPEAWGVCIFAEDKASIETFPYEEENEENIIVALTELGDNEYVSKGFLLSRDADIHVFAMGEGERHDDMVDYGWIMDTHTNRRVWEMKERDTEHAGGATKNRMVDDVIHLEAGSYKVFFVTDDSHSYGDDWNSSRPYQGRKWGITLSGGPGFDMNLIEPFVDEQERNVLAQITRMGDDEYESQSFVIDEDMNVRVYAIGEGVHGEMADYGWIKNMDTGRKVWRMEYEDTNHAGGAKKNRVVDEEIYLKKGEYKVYFQTDGSHSFADWNSRPPRDQEHWGITVSSLND